MLEFKNYLSGMGVMAGIGLASAGCFYMPDPGALLCALLLGAGAVGYLATKENRFSPGRQVAYNAAYWGIFALGMSWNWYPEIPWHFALAAKAALVGIFALQAITVTFLLNRVCHLSPSATFCLGYFAIDNINIFFFVPTSPALLAIPYANTIMHWGGLPLAILVFYLIIFALANIFLIKIIRTRKLILSRVLVCVLFAGGAVGLDNIKIEHPPRMDENKIFPRIKMIHLKNQVPPKDFAIALQLINAAPGNSLIITPKNYLSWDPAQFPPITLENLTSRNKKVLVGVGKFTAQRKHYATSYYLTNGKILFKHRQAQLFPLAEQRGAAPAAAASPLPKIYKVFGGATLMPLLGFDIMLPIRNYKYPLPDFYIAMADTEEFNQPARRVLRLLAQAVASTHHRPLFLNALAGETAIINKNGQVRTIVTKQKQNYSYVSYTQ